MSDRSKPDGERGEMGKNGPATKRPSLVIELIPCTCGGRGQDPWAHSDACPRGKAIRKSIRR